MASPHAEDNESENTMRATKGSQSIFQDYLNEKEVKFPENSDELADILPMFYSEVRKKDGSKYTKNSLCALRFGLNRHFKALLNIDTIKDKAFDRANKAHEAECLNLKSIGLDKPGHKPPISDADIKRLYESGLFDTNSPTTLQNKVFFETMLYLCRRGRQNLRHLKKDDFVIKINQQGQKYVVKKCEEGRKEEDYGEEGEIMIAGGGPLCPVHSFEKYLSHLNPVNKFLFQRPRENCPPDSMVWYDNNVIGANTLGKKMRVLSVQANLSVEYTNHSIRATTITILNRYGYLAKHIMSVSGHKNESSITKYCNRTGQTRIKMADCLMNNIIERTKRDPKPVDNRSSDDTFSSQAKKRKLHREFSNESPKNEDLHHNAAMATKNTLPVVNHDENIAPEERHSPPPEEEHSLSPDVSKSRRKVPRSHVRKVVRTDLQGKDQEETNVTQPLLVAKCETTSNERFQEPECSERQVDNMVQDVTKCRVLTSPRNENIQTVSRSGVINVTGETTLIEEDYQRKYFHLLNTMNDLQDKFLVSQRNFEDLVKAREAFIEELKGKLESNHREIGSIKQDLETSHNKISELEEEKKLYDEKIQNLSGKVEGLKVMEAEVKHQVLKSREEDELQRTTEKQQEVLDFYKLLTSITIEKTIEDEKEDSPTSYDKFRCSVKTAQAQVLQFMLSYDSEFAEVEYTPLNLNSVDSSFPEYLKEQIFFESAQAPNFLRRLIEAFQKPNEK